MNEIRKPIIIPMYPIWFNRIIDSRMPNVPWPMDTKVGTLFNFNADKKMTDTLSKIIKTVKIKYRLNKSIKVGSFRLLQKTNSLNPKNDKKTIMITTSSAIRLYTLINMDFSNFQSPRYSTWIILGNNTCVKLVAAILTISKKRTITKYLAAITGPLK